MKNLFTTLLIIFLAIGFTDAQTILWGGSDDPVASFSDSSYITTDPMMAATNGYWLTYGISSHNPDSAANAIWLYSGNGRADRGVLFGTAPAIASTSGGGAATFDSDWLDNGGLLDCTNGCDPATAGMGSAPCFDGVGFTGDGHSGALESPSIDLSANSSVQLSFNNYYRQFNSQQWVDVSNDGGVTWVPFEINTDASDNDEDQIEILDVSDVAGGQADVKIRFRWTGSYYYWIIDDVTLSTPPENNVAFPLDIGYFPRNARQPICQIDTDTFRFGAPVSNLGGADQPGLTYRIRIFNDDTGDLIYTDSVSIDMLPAGATDSILIIPTPYSAEGLDIGLYRIDNECFTPGVEDFNPSDNLIEHFFAVTESEWGAEVFGDNGVGLWNQGDPYDVGLSVATNPNCQETYFTDNVEISVGQVANDPGGPLVGRIIDFYVLRIADDVLPDYSNFDATMDFKNFDNPQLEIVGFASYTLQDGDGDFIPISGFVETNTFLDPMDPLEPGARYWVMVSHGQANQSPLHLYNTDILTRDQGLANSTLFIDGQWFSGTTFGTPVIRYNTRFSQVSVDKEPLEEDAVTLYPNPVSDQLTMDIELTEASYITVTIGDLNGRVITNRTFDKTTKTRYTYDTNRLAPGMYIAKVSTEDGYSTKKFVVQR